MAYSQTSNRPRPPILHSAPLVPRAVFTYLFTARKYKKKKKVCRLCLTTDGGLRSPSEGVVEDVADDAQHGPRHETAAEVPLRPAGLPPGRSPVPGGVMAVFPLPRGGVGGGVRRAAAAAAGSLEGVDELAGALEDEGVLGVVVALTAHLCVSGRSGGSEAKRFVLKNKICKESPRSGRMFSGFCDANQPHGLWDW